MLAIPVAIVLSVEKKNKKIKKRGKVWMLLPPAGETSLVK